MARAAVPDPRFDFRGGVNTAYSEDLLDATELRSAANLRLGDGALEKIRGSQRQHATQLGAGAAVTGLIQWDAPAPVNAKQILAIAGGVAYAKLEGDADFAFAFGGLSAAHRARFAPYRTGATIKLLLADGQLWSWDGNALTNLTATAGAPDALDVALYKLRAFAIDGTKTLYFSQISDATLWGAANQGGSADVETFDSEGLVGLKVVGGSLLLFKARSIARFTGVDADDIQIDTQTEGVSNTVGCIARATLIGLEHGAFCLSDVGPILVTESDVQELGLKVADQFDFANRAVWANAVAVHHAARHEVWLWIPPAGAGQNTTAWVWNYRLRAWSGPITGKDAASVCPFESADGTASFLRGGYDGWVRREQLEDSALEDVLHDGTGGTPIQWTAELPPLLFGSPLAIKKLRGAQSLEADLGDKNVGALTVAWTSEMGAGQVGIPSAGAGVRHYDFRLGAAGRRIVVTMSEGSAARSRLLGVSLVARPSGAFDPKGGA